MEDGLTSLLKGTDMANKEIIYYIKTEKNSDHLYHIVVAAIERLVEIKKASAIKAILDVGTSSLFKMTKK